VSRHLRSSLRRSREDRFLDTGEGGNAFNFPLLFGVIPWEDARVAAEDEDDDAVGGTGAGGGGLGFAYSPVHCRAVLLC